MVAAVWRPPDIGMDVDDAIAPCFAAPDPRIELRAVTIVNGSTGQRAAVDATR